MKFKKYNKIHALHKTECEGILNGMCYIQEKVDGANTSIWLHDGFLCYGSRNQDITNSGNGFNGFAEYIKNHEGINKLLQNVKDIRLNGEWLVKHSVAYNELSYKKFYLFDIEIGDKTISLSEMYEIAKMYNIETVKLFDVIQNPTIEDIEKYAGTSVLGNKGEGVVIKNERFVNQFGDNVFAKYVTKEFKESNHLTFNNNDKHSDKYYEMYYTNKYITLARVEKIYNKLQDLLGKLDMKHTPRILSICFHDFITEEGYTIAIEMSKSNKDFSFKTLQNLCSKKTKDIFIELLQQNND